MSDTALILGQAISDMLVTIDKELDLGLTDEELTAWIVELMPTLALQAGARRKAIR